MKVWKLFLLMILVTAQTSAQEVENQLWLNYALNIRPKPSFSYGGDIGLRGLISSEDWNQYLIRPSVTYRFSQVVSASAAMAYFGTVNKGNDNNSGEFRLHQEVRVNWPDLNILNVFYRIRVEQRWFSYQSEDEANEFRFRVRYLIGLESADIRLFGGDKPVYLQAILEGFETLSDKNASETFINRIRTYVVFGHRISEYFHYELQYINQQSRKLSDTGLETSENIFRLRAYHRIRPRVREE
jgi:hypothetical protein